jgi:hypothetical protein
MAPAPVRAAQAVAVGMALVHSMVAPVAQAGTAVQSPARAEMEDQEEIPLARVEAVAEDMAAMRAMEQAIKTAVPAATAARAEAGGQEAPDEAAMAVPEEVAETADPLVATAAEEEQAPQVVLVEAAQAITLAEVVAEAETAAMEQHREATAAVAAKAAMAGRQVRQGFRSQAQASVVTEVPAERARLQAGMVAPAARPAVACRMDRRASVVAKVHKNPHAPRRLGRAHAVRLSPCRPTPRTIRI